MRTMQNSFNAPPLWVTTLEYRAVVERTNMSLCLPASSYLNGAIIPVDGGMSIKNA